MSNTTVVIEIKARGVKNKPHKVIPLLNKHIITDFNMLVR